LAGGFLEQPWLETLPVFVTKETIARDWLKINPTGISERLGPPDVRIRFSTYLTPAWFRWRLFPEFLDPNFEWDNRPLYSPNEAARLCGLNRKPTLSRLKPVALFLWGPTEVRVQLFREVDCINLRRSIASGKVRVQTRSKVAPVFGAGVFPAMHCWNDDREDERIKLARREGEFFANLI
jgi:hypothetical protein